MRLGESVELFVERREQMITHIMCAPPQWACLDGRGQLAPRSIIRLWAQPFPFFGRPECTNQTTQAAGQGDTSKVLGVKIFAVRGRDCSEDDRLAEPEAERITPARCSSAHCETRDRRS